jgi:DNA-binding CsgD family transcriptional regulator
MTLRRCVVLVGREDELQLLEGLVGQVRAGQGAAAWVLGDPGIGKSTLIAAGLAEAERQGCQVYSATAYQQSPNFPLHVLLEALRADGPVAGAEEPGADPVTSSKAEIAGLLYGQQAQLVTPRDAVAAAAERLVTLVHQLCAVAPAILVLDDAQWADEASLAVLLRLGRALGQLPLLLVVAARSLPRRAEVEGLHEALADAGACTIELGPVGSTEAAEMVRQLIGVPPGPALAEQLTAAGGNPLYLRELIDALVRESRLSLDAEQVELRGHSSDLPATLPAAIGRRLRFLSEPTMSGLRVAAVLGPAFSADDLRVVTGQRATELIDVVNEAVSAGVLTESGPQTLAFRHGLVHQTLYGGMPASLRAALHRQAAENLAGAGAHAERVAMQLLAAPLPADAWMIDWVTGAAPMLSQRAPQVAAELLERARDGLDWRDSRREHLDADLAMTQLLLGDNEQAVRLAQPVLEHTRDPAMAGRITWTLGYALSRLDRLDQAIEVTGRALAREGLPPVWSARLRARRSMSLFGVGRYEEASAEAGRAEAEGVQAGDRLAVGFSLYTRAEVEFYYRRNAAAGKAAADRALAMLGDEPEAMDLVLLLMVNLGGALLALGLYAESDHMYGQAVALMERGTPPRQAQAWVLTAVAAFYRGHWDDALTALEVAAQLPLDALYRQSLGGAAAQVAVHRDDRAAADRLLRGAGDIELTEGDARIQFECLVVAWALAAERAAAPAEALRRLLSAFDPDGTLEFSRLGVASTPWLPDVVRLALAVGEPDVASAAAKICAREAVSQPRPTTKAAAQHCQGLVDADPAAVGAAGEIFQSIGYPLFAAQALENAAVLHAEKGDLDPARAAHRQAIAIYTDLRAEWDIMRADARLRQYKVRRGTRGTRRRPDSGWDALTPTEQKIARLVADGQSNPDIATELFLSRHTVESHVRHILAKLGAASRVEIARAVTDQ